MKDNTSLLNKVIWYDIDENGYINNIFKNQAAVYIYMIILENNEICCYVGSSIRLACRIIAHRSYVKNWGKYQNKGCPNFYKSVKKHGWFNFKLGVLEYIDLSKMEEIQKKKTLLEREQYYLDSINPSLNICKRAGSSLVVKRNIMFIVK